MKRFFAILAGPAASVTIITYGLIFERAVIYHQPLGLFYFAMIPVGILSFFYWATFLPFFIVKRPFPLGAVEMFLNAYLYHLIGFFLFPLLAENQKLLLAGILILLSFVLIFTHIRSESIARLRAVLLTHKNRWLVTFVFACFVIPVVSVLLIARYIQEPLTPFQIRAQVMSCETNNDCALFDCRGYNIGEWYCDTDGSPMCGLEKTCTCGVGCL